MRKFTARLIFTVFVLFILFFLPNYLSAQNTVTIGGTGTRSDAVLWLVPNGNQGLLLPVTSRTGFIPSSAGMIIYDPSDSKVYFWNGVAWIDMSGGGSAAAYDIRINGGNLELVENGSVVSTIPITDFDDPDNDPTNEIQDLTQVLSTGADAGNQRISNLQNPTLAQDAATKAYVDATVAVPILSIDQLQDVQAAAPNIGDILQWNGANWINTPLTGGGDLLSTNNLNDLGNIPTARTNLGLGTLATLSTITSAEITDGSVSDVDIADIDPSKFLQSGAVPGEVLQWNGSNWVPVTLPGGGDLLAANNLSDLADIPTSRTNLGLGSLATLSAIGSAEITDGSVVDIDIADIDPSKLLQSGAVPGEVLQWNGSNWVPVTLPGGGDLLAANNLSDLADIPTSRTNLGLGSLATLSAVGSAEITDGSVVDIDIANVAPSKLTQDGAVLNDILQWNGANWVPIALPGGGDLLAANNLSDLADIPTSRTNLGLGSLATLSAVGSTEITDGSVVDIDIANVAPSKLTQDGAVLNDILQWNGANWVPIALPGGGDLLAANNLSDLADIPTSRTNLGLGSLATLSAIGSAEITDGSVVDIDIANVAPSKLTQDGAALNDILQWNGANWVPIALPGGGDLLAANNLSDLADIPTSRTNLGLGSLATLSAVGSAEITDGSVVDIDIANVAPFKLTQDGAAVNDILQWNGSNWIPVVLPASGDMLATTYDPGAIAGDVFDRANHTGTQGINSIAPVGGGQRALLGSNDATNSWVTGAPDQVMTTDAGGNLIFADKSSFADVTAQTGILIGNGSNISGVASTAGVIYRGDGSTLVASNIFDDGLNVGIGTSTPRATVDIVSTDAILIPVGTTGQQPGAPASGMLRFNTDTPGFEGYDGSSWNIIGGASTGWNVTGNAGTVPGTDFIGTTDLQDLVIATNSTEQLRLDGTGTGNLLTVNDGALDDLFFSGISGEIGSANDLYIASGALIDLTATDIMSFNAGSDMDIATAGGQIRVDAFSEILLQPFSGGNVGIGTPVSANISLEIARTDAIGVPFGTTIERPAVTPGITFGYFRFNTDNTEFEGYDGANWISVGSGGWSLTGNAGTTAGTDFIGTTDTQPFEIHVDNTRVYRYELDLASAVPEAPSPNLIGGSDANSVDAGIIGGTISGGGRGPQANTISGNFGTIGGGRANIAGGVGLPNATVGGGTQNNAAGNNSTIAGGFSNTATGAYAFVGGGRFNQAVGGFNSLVNGGQNNIAQEENSAVLGGRNNIAAGRFSTVGGGEGLTAQAYNSFVVGRFNTLIGTTNGWVVTDPLFVIGNGTGVGSEADAFTVLKNGNTGILRSPVVNALEVQGDASKTVAGAWLANSDRRIKTDIQDIENATQLILSLRPVKFKYTEEWKLRNPNIRDQYYYNYIAQEFETVFPESVKGSGEYLKGSSEEILQIDSYNAQIVSIKAIQELIKRIEFLEEDNQRLKDELKVEKNNSSEIENLKSQLLEIQDLLNVKAKN